MKKFTFEELYAQQKIVGDVAKDRDKFADIVDAVGIDPSLLKGGGEDADTNLPSKLPWRLPEECGPFMAWILDNYTSSDFKALRKANFHDVSLETAGKLINGFCSILTGLGFSSDAVEKQRWKMSARMRYTVRSSRSEVEDALDGLSKLLDKYDAACLGMRKDELAYFHGFINARVKELASYIDEVYENYVDIRQDELSDLAWDEAAAMDEQEAMDRINETLILGDALEKDAKYQELSAERECLLNGNAFVKNVEKRFDRIGKEMDAIRRGHELRLFGHELPEEDMSMPALRSPADVLREAIQAVEENRASREQWEKERAQITPEEQARMREIYERICKERGFDPYPFETGDEDTEDEEG